MPTVKEPLTVSCFRCQKDLIVKFVPPRKEYSKKNNWEYWTEEERNKDKYICDKCLKNLYRKHKWDFLGEVKNNNKRQRMRNYIYEGVI